MSLGQRENLTHSGWNCRKSQRGQGKKGQRLDWKWGLEILPRFAGPQWTCAKQKSHISFPENGHHQTLVTTLLLFCTRWPGTLPALPVWLEGEWDRSWPQKWASGKEQVEGGICLHVLCLGTSWEVPLSSCSMWQPARRVAFQSIRTQVPYLPLTGCCLNQCLQSTQSQGSRCQWMD